MDKKLTIGLLLDDTLDRSDGVQQAVISIGEKLRERGHEVHYIVSETLRTDLKNVHSVGKYFSLQFNGNSVRTPRTVSKKAIKELFDEVEFDVLHVQMPYSPLFTARVLKYAPDSVKKFGTFHILPYNFMATYGTKMLGLVMQKSIRSLQTCFAVSLPAKEFMDTAFKTKGVVLPNPVNYVFYARFEKRKSKKKQIVFVGRFEERKGVEQLVDAYAGLPDEIRANSRLTMISKGPLHEKMQSKAKQLGLDIHFPGFVSEAKKAQTLADADIAVFPSISGESFGIVLTEAMAAGAGITIGGDNPGYASVLHKWPEVLFDPIDTESFTSLLLKCLTDLDFTSSIGSDQRKNVRQYDIEKVVTELEKSYTSN